MTYLDINQKQISVASVVLAGGQGTRLFPLTLHHSKPAVSFAGRYRLIDIPISNSLNSNIRQIFVIGQYLTGELQHHLSQTYQFDSFFPGMVDFLTPEENPWNEKSWFKGTADAVRKNLDIILQAPVEYFLILSGDQLYNMDFSRMLAFAKEKNADLTIASIPVCKSDATRLGLLKTDSNLFVTDFYEKPQEENIISQFRMPPGLQKEEEPKYLASMGIYIFKRKALERILKEDDREDFGKHLIPTEIKKGNTAAFIYDGYWEDIGTIESYYKANLSIVGNNCGLKTHDEENPIYTRVYHLPGSKIYGTELINTLICEGGIIHAKNIKNSVVGLRMHISSNTIIEDSVLMGNTFYLPPTHLTHYYPEKYSIGSNCIIKKAIIDEHVHIGNNVQLINKNNLEHYDGEGIYVRSGIIIVTAGTVLPDYFVF